MSVPAGAADAPAVDLDAVDRVVVDLVAVDLGASSGRVIHGRVGPGTLAIHEAHRFPNGPIVVDDTLRWDLDGLVAQIEHGLTVLGRGGVAPASIGVDSWAVDYGLLNADGRVVDRPFHYREPRTAGAVQRLRSRLPDDDQYRLTGIQHLPFNTVYQLMADRDSARSDQARRAVLVPDLVAARLGAETRTEVTNASTTGLLDARTGRWSDEVFAAAGLSPALFAPLVEPGTRTGVLAGEVAGRVGLARCAITAVASHDTASAVYAVPAVDGDDWAYVSLGTWALVGVETRHPVLTAEAAAANFTNERGVDGTTRFLRNVMGLWLLQQCLATWSASGGHPPLDDLLDAAARHPGGVVVDCDDPVFTAPGDMPSRIVDWCEDRGMRPPEGQVAVTRCVLDSLALGIARAVHDVARLTGRDLQTLHVVGGGSRNALLCQTIADRTRLDVVAGPVEATALGNLLVQAQALGALPPGAPVARAAVRAASTLAAYAPLTFREPAL